MKERPILFSAPMVRAILEGRKMMTRRVVKPQPVLNLDSADILEIGKKENRALGYFSGSTPYRWSHKDHAPEHTPCPYGQPGDRLWVRENFQMTVSGFSQSTENGYENFESFWLDYAAGGEPAKFYFVNGKPVEGTPEDVDYAMANRLSYSGREGWRPSIHMPRWASRITLEVTGVRVDRLQDISEVDARAEGAPCDLATVDSVRLGATASHRAGFIRLWESLNGAGSWDAKNPWVWVVEFKRVSGG